MNAIMFAKMAKSSPTMTTIPDSGERKPKNATDQSAFSEIWTTNKAIAPLLPGVSAGSRKMRQKEKANMA